MKIMKKAVLSCLCLALIGLLATPSVAMADTNDVKLVSEYRVTPTKAGSAGYYSKDLVTGEVTYCEPETMLAKANSSSPQYMPPNVPVSSTRGVIGEDSRVLVETPDGSYYNHCNLEITFPDGSVAPGTGFMIGPNSLATAGHCVYQGEKGGWAESILVTPATSNGSKPEGSYWSVGLACGGEWPSGNSFDDWGFIRLDSNVGEITGWLGTKAWTVEAVNNKTAIVAGYPMDLNIDQHGGNIPNYGMYAAMGRITGTRTRALPNVLHNIDTSGGQSGAPLFGFESGLGYTAYAIHIGLNYTDTENVATLINDWLYGGIRNYADREY